MNNSLWSIQSLSMFMKQAQRAFLEQPTSSGNCWERFASLSSSLLITSSPKMQLRLHVWPMQREGRTLHPEARGSSACHRALSTHVAVPQPGSVSLAHKARQSSQRAWLTKAVNLNSFYRFGRPCPQRPRVIYNLVFRIAFLV